MAGNSDIRNDAVGMEYSGKSYREWKSEGKSNNKLEINRLYKKLDDLVDSLDGLEGEVKKQREQDIKNLEKQLKSREQNERNMKQLKDAMNGLKSKLDSTMNSFIETQASMAYNLEQINEPIREITQINADLRNAIKGTGIVKQEKVYQNLTQLVRQGIVNNAEQRAYLQTLSQDLGMIFDATNGSLTRLIRLQQSDLSSHRMAIESYLKEFLLQNFKTSEYIHQGFQDVAANLLEAQSLMSGVSAMALESVVQKWMGTLSSVGMSGETISALSKTIGDIGAGNYEALSSGTGSLLTMAAARAGLNIGQLLQGGISGSNADVLMSSLVSYLGEIGGSSSNVVKAAYSKIFGFNVSDLASVGNLTDEMMSVIEQSSIGTDIGGPHGLLAKADDFIYTTTKIANILDNLLYNWGMGIATNPNQYLAYRGVDLVSSMVLPFMEQTGDALWDAADTVRYAPIIAAMGMGLWNGAKDINWSGLKGKGLKFGIDTIFPELGGIIDALAGQGGVALAIYNALGGNGNWFGKNTAAFTGSLLSFMNTTGQSTSGAGYYGNGLGSNTSATSQSNTLQVDAFNGRTMEDIYNRISDAVAAIVDLPNQSFGTVTRIAEAGNVVSIGQDSALMQDMATYIAMNVQNIYSLLVARFSGQSSANTVDTSSMNWNHPFDWMTTTVGGNV